MSRCYVRDWSKSILMQSYSAQSHQKYLMPRVILVLIRQYTEIIAGRVRYEYSIANAMPCDKPNALMASHAVN